jgi:ureidoacrylate peracid hydrolase
MHKVEIPSWAVERALARRGRLHPFDDLDPARTALVVVDLQNGFMAPGQPAEVAQAREIVPNVNCLARATRAAGGMVAWVQNTITQDTEKSWSVWFGHFAREEWGRRCGRPSPLAISVMPSMRSSKPPKAICACARPASAR